MVIAFAILGFIAGFLAGQWLLAAVLKDKTAEQLKYDENLRLYGLISWGCALLFCFLCAMLARYVGTGT